MALANASRDIGAPSVSWDFNGFHQENGAIGRKNDELQGVVANQARSVTAAGRRADIYNGREIARKTAATTRECQQRREKPASH